jgi:hypothetical protein
MFYLIAIVIVAGFLVLGCAQAMIENTIDDFEAAVNNRELEGVDDLMEVLSEDSEMMAGGRPNVEYFHLVYFDGFTPVEYSSLDIELDGGYADVYTTADYGSDPNIEVMFEMRRHGFFLFPTWKVKQYWDNNNIDNNLEIVWQRLKAIKLLEQDE